MQVAVTPIIPNIPRILAATARFESRRAAGLIQAPEAADDERRLPAQPAREAAPYLRKIFALASADLEGQARGMALSVPAELRVFIAEYMSARGWSVTYSADFSGDGSKESRVLLTRTGAA
jgi:hypothetical protein